jgi:hypothetical protein
MLALQKILTISLFCLFAGGKIYAGDLSSIKGGILVVNNADQEIIVTCLANNASSSHDLFFENSNTFLFSSEKIGSEVNLGKFPVGTELMFRIDTKCNNCPSFYTGSGERNSDGKIHALIQDVGSNTWKFSFEDMPGGGDNDYNDCVFQVTGVIGQLPVINTGECSQEELNAQYESGKQYCIDNPTSCGWTSEGLSQEDLDAKYKEGYNAGAAACSNGSATPATISADLKIHIPQLNYVSPFGTMYLWTDFEYAGESNGSLIWKLTKYGQK